MARTNATNFSGALQFPMANAATDAFKKEDVQTLALAVDQHDHSTGKGPPVSAGSIPNGTITSAMIQDGTIATADLANNAVTNAKLGTDTARLNLLTNGGFEIWQRGTSFTGPNGAWSADRWQINLNGTSAMTVAKDTATLPAGSTASMSVVYTHNVASNIQQKLEDTKGVQRPCSFSILARSSVASAVRPWWSNDGGTTKTYGAYHSGGGQYETLSVTNFTFSGGFPMVGVEFGASGTFYLDNAMLVVGSVPADYAPLHPADDLARCLRYYQRWTASIVNSLIASGQCFSTTQANVTLPLLAAMGGTPSLTNSALANWSLLSATGTNVAATALGIQGGYSGMNMAIAVNTASGLVAGNATGLYGVSGGWLALEFNP